MHVDKQGYVSKWKSQIWRGARCVIPWLVYIGRQPQTVAANGLSEGKAKVKGLLLLAAALLLTSSAKAAVPPNIILILADDLGYGDASFSGGKIGTPRLDELAAGGLRFNDFHANSNCTPTRAALMTGRYSQRSRLLAPLTPESTKGLSQNEITLPEVLPRAGYVTGLVGKWHLGKEDTFAPNLNGFDYFFGLRGGLIDYITHRDPNAGFLDWYRNQALACREGVGELRIVRLNCAGPHNRIFPHI